MIEQGWSCGDGVLERVRFFPRQLLTDGDLTDEQHYLRQKLRRHNRFAHGWGVVCGLEVKAAPTTDQPWRVCVCPGYLLTPQGDEVRIEAPCYFDLGGDWLQSQDPCKPYPCPPTGRMPAPGRQEPVYLAVRYAECDSRPVRVHPVGCACDETACEYSRIRDFFELGLLWERPESHLRALQADQTFLELLRARQRGQPLPVPPCPDCPDEPWVVVASIRLPDKAETPIAQQQIGTDLRRVLYSTGMLQLALLTT